MASPGLFHFYGLKGRLMQVASSGATGQPIARVGGFAREVWEYDDQGGCRPRLGSTSSRLQ